MLILELHHSELQERTEHHLLLERMTERLEHVQEQRLMQGHDPLGTGAYAGSTLLGAYAILDL